MNERAKAERRPRRAGGRAARHALREAGPKQRAVGAGIPGGTYRPLGERDIARIHEQALDLLENVGMAGAFPEFRDLALAKGCRMNAHDRLCFPRALIEDIVAGAAHDFVLCGRW